VDRKQFHEHAQSGECPRDVYADGVVPPKPTLMYPPVDGPVLEERRAVCEGCPIGSFAGWAEPTKMVAQCNEICRPCNTRGLINILIHKCPRGHHEG
jgi:hypothetical protein